MNDNETVYLINDIVIYDPQRRTLLNIHNERQCTLLGTCSRCLHALIQEQGDIIPHAELLTVIWPEDHEDVPYNRFYQTILNLRKSFSQVDFHQKIITTIPRKGLVIAKNITIKTHDLNHTQKVDKGEDKTPQLSILRKSKFLNNTRFFIERKMIFYPLIASLLMAFFIYIVNVREQSEYVMLENFYNSCDVYLNPDVVDVRNISNYIHGSKINCKIKKRLYVIKHENEFSVIRCLVPTVNSEDLECKLQNKGEVASTL